MPAHERANGIRQEPDLMGQLECRKLREESMVWWGHWVRTFRSGSFLSDARFRAARQVAWAENSFVPRTGSTNLSVALMKQS